MKINNVNLGSLAFDVLKYKRWRDYDRGKLAQIFEKDASHFSLYSIEFAIQETIELVEDLKKNSKDNYWGTKSAGFFPGKLESTNIVLIGDTDPEECIALYSHDEQMSPIVIYFIEDADYFDVWKKVADSFEEFHNLAMK